MFSQGAASEGPGIATTVARVTAVVWVPSLAQGTSTCHDEAKKYTHTHTVSTFGTGDVVEMGQRHEHFYNKIGPTEAQ